LISIDTNILLPAVETRNRDHGRAAGFLESLQESEDVAISEFVLLELYVLLRNPAVLGRPLTAVAAADVCAAFRAHPHWQILGFPPSSRAFHDRLWLRLRETGFARRRAFAWRSALSLLDQGVTEFATTNVKDFDGFGFMRVWNPLTGG
jgi:predicted nucleic acid-binding protein